MLHSFFKIITSSLLLLILISGRYKKRKIDGVNYKIAVEHNSMYNFITIHKLQGRKNIESLYFTVHGKNREKDSANCNLSLEISQHLKNEVKSHWLGVTRKDTMLKIDRRIALPMQFKSFDSTFRFLLNDEIINGYNHRIRNSKKYIDSIIGFVKVNLLIP